jgi:Peptidase C13 family
MDGIMADQLWGAQPSLILDAAKNFRPRVSGKSNIYAMALAADGTQQIFSREGRAALKSAEERFGESYRGGMLLSNGSTDLMRTPLATLDNLSAAMDQFSARADPATDIALIYLTSHGSEDAELSTGLPNYTQLTLFTANAVADVLARTGIRRRIIIVSACYSGSWIPALANDDTIIVTASSKDRTSFGCDDRRNVTLFGEHFLLDKSAQRSSLKDIFEAARTNIERQEAAWKIIRSRPQAYVGKNMQSIWTQQF